MTKARVSLLSLAVFTAAFISPEGSTWAQGLYPMRQITDLAKEIQVPMRSSSQRQEEAQRLAQMMRTVDVSLVDDRTVDLIAALLQDEDDIIRFNAAKALRYVGARAKRAVPRLEAALAKIHLELNAKKFWTGTSSEDEICPALQRILGKKVAPGCAFSYPVDN